MAGKRRRFTSEFKARVALEALRERDSLQAIAMRHELHPNQVSTWKRQLLEGLPEVFAAGAGRKLAKEHEARVRDLHAKIGELTGERDVFRRGSSAEPVGAGADDRAGRAADRSAPPLPFARLVGAHRALARPSGATVARARRSRARSH
ncbi:transposase [Candidatus Palauibacter sp.]|uniref:transposase n=1 Tax=Candidatus Palauibacter sp. TaxID=3101350 RepID=UPI003B52FFA2